MARVHKPARRLRADPREGRKKKRSAKTDHETVVVRKPASVDGVKLDVDVRIPDWLRNDVGPKDDPEELDGHEA